MAEDQQNQEQLHEGKMAQMEKQAERLYEEFKPQMDLLSKSPLIRVKDTMSAYDVYALGKQLESYEQYKAMTEAEGSVGDLGRLPNIALDVITVAYGSSIIPAICTVQPIEDEAGNVFFKDLISNTTRGNITADQKLLNPTGGQPTTPHGFATNQVTNLALGTWTGAQAATVTQTVQLSAGYIPLRPNTLHITVVGSTTVYGKDDGLGIIIGRGVDGTVNYITGEIVLNFRVAPNAVVYGSFQLDVERASTIPSIRSVWRSKNVVAHIYALQGSIGLLQAFGARKKFGALMDDELASDLVTEMNAEVGGDLVRKLFNARVGINGVVGGGDTTWNRQRPANISEFEHRQGFQFAITDAEAVLSQNAGRGQINGLIGGAQFVKYLANQPQFVKAENVSTVGPSIYGTYNGITVIRIPDNTYCDPYAGVGFYKGPSPFEGPAVYAPFMPLTVTSTLPGASNPLQNRKAAAVWAAVDILVPNYVTGISIVSTAQGGSIGVDYIGGDTSQATGTLVDASEGSDSYPNPG